MSSHRSPKTKMPAYDAARHRAWKDKARGIDCDSESEFSDSEFMIDSKDEPMMSATDAARRRAFKDKAREIDSDSESEDAKEEMILQLKANIKTEVIKTMMTLVYCLWVSSSEYRERPRKYRAMDPSPKTQARLINKAAIVMKRKYKHDHEVFGYCRYSSKYQLMFIYEVIENLESFHFWDGKCTLDDSSESEEEKNKPKYG